MGCVIYWIRVMAEPILTIDNLRVEFPTRGGGVTTAVGGVSFTVGAERVALVGESGSGKSMTARATLGLVPPPGRVIAKSLQLNGRDLLSLSPRDWTKTRGAEVGFVLQDPRFALNPLLRVGAQVE